MKNFILLSALIIAIQSCSQTQSLNQPLLNGMGRQEEIKDSVLNAIRQKSDVVLAFAVENYAWGRTTNFLILSKTGENWMGYNYFVNSIAGSTINGNETFNINPAVVNEKSADSLLAFLKEKKVWEIQGDNNEGFCPDGNKNCMINDAPVERLWIVTKESLVNPSYYAPAFYEECCPGNENRQLFIKITQNIRRIVAIEAHSR